jgi:hypothetical protein
MNYSGINTRVSHTPSESVASLQTRSLNRVSVIHQTPHVSYVQTALTIAAVAENMCMSRCRKADHVGFKTLVQTPAIIVLLLALKPNQLPVRLVCLEPDQHRNLTSKVHIDQTVC